MIGVHGALDRALNWFFKFEKWSTRKVHPSWAAFPKPLEATNAKHYLLYQRAEAKVMETGLNLLGDWVNAYRERQNPNRPTGFNGFGF